MAVRNDKLGQPVGCSAAEQPGGFKVSLAHRCDWDHLVIQFPEHTIFHKLGWLQSLERAHRLELLLLQAHCDGQVAAVWPCLALRKGPFRVVGSPLPGWSTVYMGPLFASGVNPGRAMGAFLRSPSLARAAYIYCKVLDEGRPIDLASVGFNRKHQYRTYIVPLRCTEEELWARLEKRCRRAISKARKAGLVVRREEGSDFLDDFWWMSQEVFARSHMKPTYSRDFVAQVCEGLKTRDELFVMSVVFEGKRISTQILPRDELTAYAWAAASDPTYRHLSTSNILDWETILEARRMGLWYYDLVSVYGGPGLYKRSFGPDERSRATHWERARSPLIGAAKHFYERWSRHQLRIKRPVPQPGSLQ